MKISDAKSGQKVTVATGPAAGREVEIGHLQVVNGKTISVKDPRTGETQSVRADLEVK